MECFRKTTVALLRMMFPSRATGHNDDHWTVGVTGLVTGVVSWSVAWSAGLLVVLTPGIFGQLLANVFDQATGVKQVDHLQQHAIRFFNT